MLALDHIIIPSLDPKETAEQFSEQHDIHVVKGGRHEYWGTYNYLAYFKNNAYIEWIGIEQMHIAEQSTNPLIQQVVHAIKNKIQRPIQYAIRTNQIDQIVSYFEENDMSFSGPVQGSRDRADGTLLEWEMLFPRCPTSYPLPFLIQWGEQPNVPADESLINDVNLSSITDKRPNHSTFRAIFQLGSSSAIALENARLSLEAGDELTFTLT